MKITVFRWPMAYLIFILFGTEGTAAGLAGDFRNGIRTVWVSHVSHWQVFD